MKLPALTLWQPWASLMTLLDPSTGKPFKQVETRGWRTTYRGPIVIHAAARKLTEDERYMIASEPAFLNAFFPKVGERIGLANHIEAYGGAPWPPWVMERFPLGRILGIGYVAACHPTSQYQVAEHERPFGDYRPGRWAWELKKLHALSPEWQLPTQGARQLWDVDLPEELIASWNRLHFSDRLGIKAATLPGLL